MHSHYEILAVIFSLISVYLTVRENILCWIFGIVGVSYYGLLFFDAELYGQVILQVVFFLQCVYGWYNWNNSKKEKDVSEYDYPTKSMIILSIVLLCFFSKIIFDTANDIDMFITILSLFANYMLAKKKLESWLLWIMVDIMAIYLFYTKELYLSMCLYGLFLIMATNGLITWKKRITTD